MSLPPQPGQWGPGNPPPSGPPQGYPQQPPGPPQQPPGYYPQPGWGPQQPPPPPKQGNSLKWLLIAVAVLLVIAITVGVTLFFTRGSGGGSSTTPAASDIASANDTGPVAIITVEPTCDSWRPIQASLATSESNGWGQRDPSMPSSEWTPDLRAQFEAVGKTMRTAADQAVGLAKQTPHRVMREIYEQFIVYGRAYADSLSAYVPQDDFLSRANVSFSRSISGICDAIQYGNVIARASAVPPAKSPAHLAQVGDPSNPEKFVSSATGACVNWISKDAAFTAGLQDWSSLDPKTPATDWTPEYRGIQERTAKLMDGYATDIESIGRNSGDGTMEDFSALAALYLRAYTIATPTYTVTDNYIVTPGLRINNAVTSACQAA